MPHRPVARLVALTAGLWIAGLALAQAQPQQPQLPSPQPAADNPALAAFNGADTNKDGMLNREECAKLPVISARFAELDKNKDGQLSWEEFKTGYAAAP